MVENRIQNDFHSALMRAFHKVFQVVFITELPVDFEVIGYIVLVV